MKTKDKSIPFLPVWLVRFRDQFEVCVKGAQQQQHLKAEHHLMAAAQTCSFTCGCNHFCLAL